MEEPKTCRLTPAVMCDPVLCGERRRAAPGGQVAAWKTCSGEMKPPQCQRLNAIRHAHICLFTSTGSHLAIDALRQRPAVAQVSAAG